MEAKIKQIIETLNEKTIRKVALWERVGNLEKFMLKLDNGMFSIEIVPGVPGTWYYQFTILNLSGEIITSVRGSNKEVPLGEEFKLLKELFVNVKRVYLKVDETIDGLLNEINKKNTIGGKNI